MVVYPLAPGAESPIRAVRHCAVGAASGRPPEDAIGIEVHFVDGTRHQLLCSGRAGVPRRMDGFETEAAVALRKLSGEETREVTVF